MYESQTQEAILERMLGRVSNQMDKRQSSLIWDTHSSTAIELQNLYIELDTMISNSYGDTAAREFLIRLAKDRGITAEPATKAVLKGLFEPANIDMTGQRFNIDRLNYVVGEKIADGEYQVQCETAGIIGNQYLGRMIPIDYINGLQSAELVQVLIPGEDEENTEALRQRYLDSFSSAAFGGNRTDYLAKIKAINGVGDVKIERVWNGGLKPADMIPSADVTSWYNTTMSGTISTAAANWLRTVYTAAHDKKLTVGGTVLVCIVDSDDFGPCSDTLVNTVQTAIDPTQNAGEGEGLAPIGHVVNVRSASAVQVNIKTQLTFEQGYSWANLQKSIEAAAAAYLLELRKEWASRGSLVVRVSRIESEILTVRGVADITGTKLNGIADNLQLGAYDVPSLGEVSA